MAKLPSDEAISGALSVVMAKIKEQILRIIDSIPQAAESRPQIEAALDNAINSVDWTGTVATAKAELVELLLTGRSEVDNQPSDLA